jgi:hypothetical protein
MVPHRPFATVTFRQQRGKNPEHDGTQAALCQKQTSKGSPLLSQFFCGRQIIRTATGIFRNSTVSAQLMESVPVNTIANLTNAGKAGS